jgi:predicted RNA binding protein YcfA (HicA-like mRNA interferase family)
MGVDTTIEQLRTNLAAVFRDTEMPPGWEDDWIIVPLDKPESSNEVPDIDEFLQAPMGANDRTTIPDFGGGFPGAPQPQSESRYPSPDVWAFYLPFHYYKEWWGVYLLIEGVSEFTDVLQGLSKGALSRVDARFAARVFLYGHEAFHHIVETFATRLEVTHRKPLYVSPFERLYRESLGTDDCLEEALANAHAYRLTRRVFRKDKAKQEAVCKALRAYMKHCGPGYRCGSEFLMNREFSKGKELFAEGNHREMGHAPTVGSAVWQAFPHAFSGWSRVTSRVNYLVHRHSPLVERTGLGLRYLRRRDLIDRLKNLAGCVLVREGSEHEVWRAADGQCFAIPRHRDIAKGTVSKIIKQAGLNLSYEQFLQAELA